MVLFGVLLTCIPRCGRLNSIRVVGAKDVLPNFPFGVELGFFFVFLFFCFFVFLFCFVFVPSSALFGCCNVEMD